jgi:hypothetical protein
MAKEKKLAREKKYWLKGVYASVCCLLGWERIYHGIWGRYHGEYEYECTCTNELTG